MHDFRLPQLDGVAFRIVYPRKAPVRISLRIDLDFDSRAAKLRDHRIQVAHAEIDQPLFVLIAEIVRCFGTAHRYPRPFPSLHFLLI